MKQSVKLIALILAFGAAGRACGDVILQSALLGATGQVSGVFISATEGAIQGQFLGGRFHVSEPLLVDHIGGHLSGVGNGSIFGALVTLGSPTAFPSSSPLSFNPLAQTVFTPISPSTDFLVPLSVALSPGDYALIFGSGRFGASGSAMMPANGFDTPQASYFRSDGDGWFEAPFSNTRFVVTGTIVPEPTIIALLGIAAACGLLRHWLRTTSENKDRGST